MAKFDTTWYVNYGNGTNTGYYALTQWATATAKTVGNLVRQLAAPAVASERVFMCIVAGTTHATTEPTWTTTRGAKTTDNTVTWMEVSGVAAVNGDTTNTPLSSSLRSLVFDLGVTMKNNAGTHLFICTTAGTGGAGEPTYSTTTGATTADNTATWTCIGAINAFSGGQGPHARLRNALASTWYVNGSTVYIGHNSAETQAAAYTISAGQKSTAPLKVICNTSSGSYPPTASDVTTGATITTTGANGITMSSIGCYMDGVTFQAGSGAVSQGIDFGSQNGTQYYKNCSFQKLGTTGAVAALTGNSGVIDLIFDNCTFKFGSVSDGFRLRTFSRCIIKNNPTGILASGSSVPTQFISATPTGSSSYHANLIIEGCDLSQFGSGKTIMNSGNADTASVGYMLIKDCKLDASVTLVPDQLCPNTIVDVVRCSSTTDNYKTSRYTFSGTETTESTIIRTGGANDGVTGYSHKIVTGALCTWYIPYEMQPLVVYNSTTGSAINVTVEGIWGSGSRPNNNDIWIDVVYPGSSSTPLATFGTTGLANALTTATSTTASGSSWGGSTTAFKMTKSITPQMKGPIYVYVKVGATSTTIYVDPKITLS